MAEPASLGLVGGDFGFKAEMLSAVPGTLAWHVVYFFLVPIVIGDGGCLCVVLLFREVALGVAGSCMPMLLPPPSDLMAEQWRFPE